MVESLDSEEVTPEDRFANASDSEVLDAAFAGDADAQAEYNRRRAQAAGSTASPSGGMPPPAPASSTEGSA